MKQTPDRGPLSNVNPPSGAGQDAGRHRAEGLGGGRKARIELRLLVTAVVVMMVGLVASLVLFGRVSRSLAAAHAVIVDNAAPSVVALDGAQARLRRLHMLVLQRRLGAPGDPAVREASIAAARRDVGGAIDEYLALPTEPGEIPLQRAIRESLAQVNVVIDRTLELAPGAEAGDIGVRHDLDAALAQLSLDLAQASEFAAQMASRAAAGAIEVSSASLPAVAAIEGLTFLAATVALGLTYRAVRRALALAEKSRASLERRAEELELFAARVAHDLLSPLMTVAVALDLASPRLSDPADATAHKAVARASGTLNRVRRFVSDLLEFARAGARPPPGVRAGVQEALHEIVEEFTPIAEDAGVDLRVEPAPAAREVACSPGVLTSILSNLVENAIKYIGEREVRRVSIRGVEQMDEVRVEVEDTGPGIPPEDRDRLFEPYARGRDAKASGLGLGLSTVRRLVESHGGRVGVTTAPGQGSVFWFSLPIAA